MPSLNLVDYVTKRNYNTLSFLFQGKKRNFSHFLPMIQKDRCEIHICLFYVCRENANLKKEIPVQWKVK